MNEFYRRVLLPLTIPLLAIGVIVLVVLDLSRVLLAVQGKAATIVAAGVASAILFGAARFSIRGRAGSSTGLGLVALAGFILVFGGLIGMARLDEEKAELAAGQKAKAAEAGPPDVTVTAYDIGFRQKQLSARAGRVRIAYVDEGQLAHTLVIDGQPKFRRLEVAGKGDRAQGTANLAPGSYVFYCDVPGHRQAGMEGRLVVGAG